MVKVKSTSDELLTDRDQAFQKARDLAMRLGHAAAVSAKSNNTLRAGGPGSKEYWVSDSWTPRPRGFRVIALVSCKGPIQMLDPKEVSLLLTDGKPGRET